MTVIRIEDLPIDKQRELVEEIKGWTKATRPTKSRYRKPRTGPTEHQAQVSLFQYAERHLAAVPELEMMFAIPNVGSKSKVEGARKKAEGRKKGVPDLMLCVARRGYHGLFIEMKIKGGKVSDEQQWWLDRLREQGYLTTVAWTPVAAWNVLMEYLGRNEWCVVEGDLL